jgi:hypothetical protein
MTVDYPGAIDRIITDPAWIFPDALKGLSGNDLSIVNHKTASNRQNSALDEANFFHNDTQSHKSVHFVIGRDGMVVQVVRLKDGAGGNCCLEDGHDTYWDSFKAKYGNLNRCTFSIEHVDWTSDNSQLMTQAQIDASFNLNLWLCQTFHIPVSHIKRHSSLDPKSKARCPGPTFPMADLIKYVEQHLQGGESLPLLTHNGAVLDLQKSFQLDGRSQDKCGPWSVAELLYAGLPGRGPTGTPSQIQAWAHQKYEQYIGPDILSNEGGSSIENMHSFLKDAGLHWSDIPSIRVGSKQSDDIARLHRATDAGYPVLVTVNEQSIKRRNGTNPYPWQPRLGPVNHIFTIIGHTNDGYVLVDDELNQNDPWPNEYSEAAIECHWACTVQVIGPNASSPWVAGIPGDDPLNWPTGFNAQLFAGALQKGAFPMALPSGAKDNGKDTITFSNGKVMVKGFRAKYLDMVAKGQVPPDDMALENEHGENVPEQSNPPYWPNGGTVQATRYFRFAWSSEHGVVWTYIGAELLWYQAHQQSGEVAALQKQVDDLKAQLAAAPQAANNEMEHHALMSVHATLHDAYTSMNDMIERALGGSPS